MAATKWKLYDTAKLKIAQAIIDLDTHTFKCALFLSTSNCNTLTFDELADLTNQVASGFGYTTAGETLTTVTLTNTSGTIKFTSDDVRWIAAGGSITARFAVIYDDTVVGDPLLCICRLDTGDVTANDTEELKIAMSASGIFTMSGGNTD